MEKRNSKGQFIKGNKNWNAGTKGLMKGMVGEKNPRWKGGKFIHHEYWYVHKPGHPSCHKGGGGKNHVKRCILVAEKYLKRYLNKEEIVHHINEIKLDDRPENLYIFPNNTEHHRFHFTWIKQKTKLILKSNVKE